MRRGRSLAAERSIAAMAETTKIRFRTSQTLAGIVSGGDGVGGSGSSAHRHHYIISEHITHPHTHTPTHNIYIYTVELTERPLTEKRVDFNITTY